MRVLILTWEYPPHIVGGLGAHVANLTPDLLAEGVQVQILTPMLRGGSPVEVTPNGIHISRISLSCTDDTNFIHFVAQANQQLEQAAHELSQQNGRFDIIHTHDWLTATSAIALKQAWHVPLLATIHATERGRGRGMLHGEQAQQIDRLEYQLSYEAWRIIVCSRFMLKQLVETFQTPVDKIDIVPNGTNLCAGPFQKSDERLLFRRSVVPDDTVIIFYVGRIVYEKGLHILLDAMPKVCEHINAHLVIAGTGPYLDSLKAQAEAIKVTQHVTFAGFISDENRDRLYHVADVTTFPSLYEPFGIVVLEAYAAKSPVVVSQTGGLMEVVHANETGLTVIPGDADSLSQGIVRTILEPEQTRIRVENALEELCTRYNWRHIARETIAVYHQIYREWQASSWGKESPQSQTSSDGGEGGTGGTCLDDVWRRAG
jgi:glycogen synthase